ncbi:hypothetical protein DM860_017204 [Cuscuta australis]|uniref:Cupin type-1 domain-containing protein n=1 Tax=Cuscuta australis TaxID=267555 RepID=A0A328E4S7_9ASTE|nr:hypothetical protein DM860_017204 [Cuscuta australis]
MATGRTSVSSSSATSGHVIANLALLLFLLILSLNPPVPTAAAALEHEVEEGSGGRRPFLVKKGERETTVSTEDGEVSTVRISDGIGNGRFHIESITLEPNALFLPVLLQSEMVFYVHTGSGNISWTEESETKQVEVEKGDIYRLEPGTVFYIESSPSSDSEKLRIYAFFANAENDLHEPAIRPYSSIRDLILGFDKSVLEAAFGVPSEAIEEITEGADPGGIVHGLKKEESRRDREFAFMRALLGGNGYVVFIPGENKKNKLFNVFSNEPDFKNCNGWSTVVTKKQLSALKGIDISVFMVNLTKGSIMGPHWNPRASEFGICLHGQGMVTVVCPSSGNRTSCKNMRFHVEEGDVFAVPRFHPMAQVAFNNDSFVFMGFSTAAKNNHPQYLAGKASVLRTLDRDILSVSLDAKNTTVDKILNQQEQAIILECTSCAEEEFKVMKEEIQKEKEEEKKKKEEEEKKKKEEEEKKKQEEEEKKKQEEEEKKKQEEEEKRKQEEEEKKKQEEEEKKKKEEEEKRREKQEKEREEEEEEAKKRQEEEAKKKEEEEQRREEEEAARREEEAKKKEEEAKKREEQRQKEEEARKKEEEAKEKEKQRKKEEEEEAARKEEEERREEAARKEEEERREEESRQKKEEEAAKQHKEEEEEEEEERHEGGGWEWGEEGPAGMDMDWGRKVLNKKKKKKDMNGA